MRSTLVLLLAMLASPLTAQQPHAKPRLEVGVEFSHWNLGESFRGTSTLQSGTVRAAVLLPGRMPATLGVSATYVPQAGAGTPEMLGFSGELTQRVLARRRDQPNLFVGAGAGVLRLSTEQLFVVIPDCPSLGGCIDPGGENNGLSSGWRPTLSASAGADVPLLRGSLLQPTVQVVRTFGHEREGSAADVLVRLGVGLAWRP